MSPPLSRLPTHHDNHFGGSQALSAFHLPPSSLDRPRSRSRSRLYACPRVHSRPRPRPHSCLHLRPCSRHRFFLSVPGTLFSPRYHIIVRQALGLAPKAAGYLQALPPVYRDDAVCRIPGLLLCFFLDVADTRRALSPPCLSILVPVPVSIPIPVPTPGPVLAPVLRSFSRRVYAWVCVCSTQ